MKKRVSIRLITTLMLSLCMLFVGTVSSFAADGDTDKNPNLPYKYTVTVNSGIQGVYTNGSQTGKTVSKQYAPGETVYISINDKANNNYVTLNNDVKDKYYVKGFRVSGHDAGDLKTSENETTGFTSLTFNASCDVSYTAVYGLAGDLVKYTVNYIDKDSGAAVATSDEYYGMPGDKPVVSYRYVKGYMPSVFSMRKTLSADESENVFTFEYEEANAENTIIPGKTTTVNRNGNAANGAIAPGTAGNPAGTNIAANAVPNAAPGANNGTTTIGDNATPLQYQDIDENDTPLAGVNKGLLFGSIGAIILIIALIAAFLARRKKNGAESLK